jgi:hypothetical protein
MANPFPGMDPYLEGNLWPTVHANLGTEVARRLNATIRPKYVALTVQRVVLAVFDEPERSQDRWPDVGVVTREPRDAGGATAVATAPLEANAPAPESIPQYSVEIRDTAGRRLVTSIEILSPTNKRGDGRDEYAVRRREILAGPAHLVEIDLLRAGDRFPVDRPLPSVPYFVFVSRVERRPRVQIWPIPLAGPLPPVRVPLGPGDPDATFDLQEVLATLHDDMGYDLSVDYTRPPPGPLSPDEAAWVEQRLREAGRRP